MGCPVYLYFFLFKVSSSFLILYLMSVKSSFSKISDVKVSSSFSILYLRFVNSFVSKISDVPALIRNIPTLMSSIIATPTPVANRLTNNPTAIVPKICIVFISSTI